MHDRIMHFGDKIMKLGTIEAVVILIILSDNSISTAYAVMWFLSLRPSVYLAVCHVCVNQNE